MGLTYNGIEYPDDFTQDQFEQHTDVPQELIDAHFGLVECHRARREAYPPIEDQLDRIYHGGIEAWQSDIAAVKAQYPKPDEV